MKLILKNLSYLFFAAVYSLKKLVTPQKEVYVLMYHSVEDTDWKYGVRPKDFQKQIGYLKDNYHVVPLERVVNFIKSRDDLPNKSVALTFDDGYLDTYQTVFPLLKQYQLPATVFLTTNLAPQPKLGNLPRLNWEQIKEMFASGLVKFEVHGHNHQELSAEEVLQCREAIANHLQYQSQLIAYPAGRHNPAIVNFLKNNGFLAAFGISEGLVKQGDDLFNIKRIQIDKTMNFMLFKLRLTGAIEWHRRFINLWRKYLVPSAS